MTPNPLFTAPFVIKPREDYPFATSQVLALVGGKGPGGQDGLVATVGVIPLQQGYFEVTEVRPVLDEGQGRLALLKVRQQLLLERISRTSGERIFPLLEDQMRQLLLQQGL